MTNPQQFKESIKNLKEQIKALQKAVQKMKQSGINENVLCSALQRCANRFYLKGGLYRKPINVGAVKAILQGIDKLEEYLFPPEVEESVEK